MLESWLGLNIKFHHEDGRAEDGEIFLFNHFARFETIMPPYLLHKETGAYCWSVATKDFFALITILIESDRSSICAQVERHIRRLSTAAPHCFLAAAGR